MKKHKRIRAKYLPAQLPVLSACVAYLMLKEFNSPDYVYGIVGTLFFVYTLLVIGAHYTSEFTAPNQIGDE